MDTKSKTNYTAVLPSPWKELCHHSLYANTLPIGVCMHANMTFEAHTPLFECGTLCSLPAVQPAACRRHRTSRHHLQHSCRLPRHCRCLLAAATLPSPPPRPHMHACCSAISITSLQHACEGRGRGGIGTGRRAGRRRIWRRCCEEAVAVAARAVGIGGEGCGNRCCGVCGCVWGGSGTVGRGSTARGDGGGDQRGGGGTCAGAG